MEYVVFIVIVLFFIGFFVSRFVLLTEKMESETTLSGAISILLKQRNVIDLILMPAYVVMTLLVAIVFLGISAGDKPEDDNETLRND